jgi:uncharacterized protein involved in exopolysaccharide biosynthesis
LNTERTLLEGFVYYATALWRYRWLIVGITGVAALGVLAFCIASVMLPPERSPLPNKYTASAVILAHSETENDLTSSIRAALGIVGAPADTGAGFDNGAFLVMVLRSRIFLDEMADEFGIVKRYHIKDHEKSRSRGLLLSKLRFVNDRTTGAIWVTCTDTDPVFARDLANREVSFLSEWYSQNMGSANSKQKQLLEEKIAEVKAGIDTLESRLADLRSKYGALNAQDLGTSQASTLAALRSQLILKDIDIRNYTNSGSATSPKLRQLKEERQNILDLINRLQQGMPDIADPGTSQKSLPDVQTEFTNLSTELDIQWKIYNTLSHQYEALKLTSDSQPPFQILELAEVPDSKSGPQRVRIIAEVAFIAFAVSVALALFLNAISGLRDRERQKKLPTAERELLTRKTTIRTGER